LTAYKKSDVKIGDIVWSNYTVFVFLCLISRPAVTLTKFLFTHGMYKTVHPCKCVCMEGIRPDPREVQHCNSCHSKH
jgi:hypothetical protein